MKKFDQRYPNARTGSGNASWPRGVHKISQIGLDNLGVDNEGRLYWNGQMVKEANPLELNLPTRSQRHHRNCVRRGVGRGDTCFGCGRYRPIVRVRPLRMKLRAPLS